MKVDGLSEADQARLDALIDWTKQQGGFAGYVASRSDAEIRSDAEKVWERVRKREAKGSAPVRKRGRRS